MKKVILILFAFCSSFTYAQTLPNFDLIKLEKTADYKAADPFVLQTATYLLATPIKKDSPDRLNALRFISKWMSGTPDHSFVFGGEDAGIYKDNNDVLGVYMAAMAKYTLENKEASKDAKLVKLNAITLLLNYCENKDNNIRMTKQLRKLAEAKAKGTLEQAI